MILFIPSVTSVDYHVEAARSLCLGLPGRLLKAAFVNQIRQPQPPSETPTVAPAAPVPHRGSQEHGRAEKLPERGAPSFHPAQDPEQRALAWFTIVFPNWYQQLLSSLHKTNIAVSLFYY